jgi:hypothetical protein
MDISHSDKRGNVSHGSVHNPTCWAPTKCNNSNHRLVVNTQICRLQRRSHTRRYLAPLVCISSLSLAQRSERRSGYHCLASCSLFSGLQVENRSARGTQKTDSIRFIIVLGCLAMVRHNDRPCETDKVHKGWTFLTRGHNARGHGDTARLLPR